MVIFEKFFFILKLKASILKICQCSVIIRIIVAPTYYLEKERAVETRDIIMYVRDIMFL